MSMKDEIDKIIQIERQKLDAKDSADREFYQRQLQRFTQLRAVIEELINSVESRFVQADLRNGSSTLKVGHTEPSGFIVDVLWEIWPNYQLSDHAELPGFIVEETTYYYMPKYDERESRRTFPSEHEVVEYVTATIAKNIAYRQHLEDMSAKRSAAK